MGDDGMIDFLENLAERKYCLYHALNVAMPQAYNSKDCISRLNIISQYEELLRVINLLPPNEKRVVEERFEEMKTNL